MTNEQRLVIERECERLILHSAKLSDHAKIEELAGLFTHDAELVRPSGVGASIVGRAAILASLRAAPKATKAHVITNVVVEVASPTSAHVASVAIRFSGPVADDGSGGTVAGTKIAVGYFEDDLVLTSEGWAFQRRHGSMAMEFSVGSGLTAEQKKTFWTDRKRLAGKVLRYKYFPIGVKDKPRFPGFLGFRSSDDM